MLVYASPLAPCIFHRVSCLHINSANPQSPAGECQGNLFANRHARLGFTLLGREKGVLAYVLLHFGLGISIETLVSGSIPPPNSREPRYSLLNHSRYSLAKCVRLWRAWCSFTMVFHSIRLSKRAGRSLADHQCVLCSRSLLVRTCATLTHPQSPIKHHVPC